MLYLSGVLFSELSSKAAYLDPGSGSFLIQLLIAGVAGLGIAIGASWNKIKRWFKKGKAGEVVEEETEEQDDD